MSLIITIYLNDAIVMASDSRTTLTTSTIGQNGSMIINSFPFSDSTNKTFVAPNGCGVSTCGDSSYQNKPIAGFIDKFFASSIKKSTSIFDLCTLLTDYFTNLDGDKCTIFHIAGYELNASNEYDEMVYRCVTGANKVITKMSTNSQGAMWDGETETLTRLIKPVIVNPEGIEVNDFKLFVNNKQSIQFDAIVLEKSKIIRLNEDSIQWQLMSVKDAIDFINFAFETTINHMRFQATNKTVGGPIDVLLIKPNEAKWIKKKKI